MARQTEFSNDEILKGIDNFIKLGILESIDIDGKVKHQLTKSFDNLFQKKTRDFILSNIKIIAKYKTDYFITKVLVYSLLEFTNPKGLTSKELRLYSKIIEACYDIDKGALEKLFEFMKHFPLTKSRFKECYSAWQKKLSING